MTDLPEFQEEPEEWLRKKADELQTRINTIENKLELHLAEKDTKIKILQEELALQGLRLDKHEKTTGGHA